MVKVFYDTNVLLDVLQKRQPFYPSSFEALHLALSGKVTASISPISIADINYIAREVRLPKRVGFFQTLRARMEITPMDSTTIDATLQSHWKDLEDAMQYFAAQTWGAQYFITRNTNDFPATAKPIVLTPDQLLSLLKTQQKP